MFQTEPIAWIQSFSTPWLDMFMRSVSFIGNGEIVAALLIVLIFGFYFRLGMTILLAVLLGSGITNSLKNAFEFPRPVFVSAHVGEPGDDSPPPTIYDGGGAGSFWALPLPEAITAVRKVHRKRGKRADGFPSGHVTTAVALSVGVALLLGGVRYLPIALAWTFLMALSRMYLGRHFLADTVAGVCIGLLSVVLVISATGAFREAKGRESWPVIAMIGITSCFAALLPVAELNNLGELAGLCLGLVLILRLGVPDDTAPIGKRVSRVALGAVIFVGAQFALSKAMLEQSFHGGEFFESLIVIAFTCVLTVLIGKRLKLYKNGEQSPQDISTRKIP